MIKILDDIQKFINSFVGCDSVSTIYTIIFMCLICSLLVLFSHFSIHKLFNKDLLGIGEFKKLKWSLWILGTIVTYLLLYLMGIMNYSVQSIVIVAFTWNILLESTVKKLKETPKKDIDKAIKSLNSDIDDFA